MRRFFMATILSIYDTVLVIFVSNENDARKTVINHLLNSMKIVVTHQRLTRWVAYLQPIY